MGQYGVVPAGDGNLPALEEKTPTALAETASAAVAAQARAQVEAAYLVALRNPRDWMVVRSKVLATCKRPRFAETALYSKPIGGKRIENLSIRFAEEAARAMGNLHTAVTVVFDDAERRIVVVTVTDLENNVPRSLSLTIEKTVERRNVKQGQQVIAERENSYGDTVYLVAATEDDLLTKQGALVSKAERQLVLKHMPSDIQEEAIEQIRATRANEDRADPQARLKKLVDAFFPLGVDAKELQAFLGHSLATINPAELDLLRSVYTAVSQGESTWQEAVELRMDGSLQAAGEARAKASTTDQLKDRLAKGKKKEEPKAEVRAETEDERMERLEAERQAAMDAEGGA